MEFVNVHSHIIAKNNAITLLNCYPTQITATNFFSVGMHPWYIKEESIAIELLLVKKYITSKNCKAIGECGLDKLCTTNFELQKEVFKKHIELSEVYKKPLLIHCVKAYQEILELKKEIQPKQKWIIHGFVKKEQLAKALLKNGCILSFGKALVIKSNLQEVFKKIPLEYLFLETDTATIAIEEIYKKAAILKGITIEELKEKLYYNFNRIFIQ